jgi:hypothetical protein
MHSTQALGLVLWGPNDPLMIMRFAVATLSLCISFVFLGGLLHRFESGLYSSHEVPFGPPDEPHKRARRSFDKATVLVLLVISVLGFLAHQCMSATDWSNIGVPALVGGYFSMLYAFGTRRDCVRPRLS